LEKHGANLGIRGAFMESIRKYKKFVAFYLSALFLLLLCVIATPMLIQHNLSVTREFIIEEEVLETALIITLFGVSWLILRAFKRSLISYRQAVSQAGAEKSKLVARLSEAFSYIGTVNVEIQEIQSILCRIDHYPQTRRELKQIVHWLAAKAMSITGTPWIVFRIIARSKCRTVYEYSLEHPKETRPTVTMGNRAILDGQHVQGVKIIGSYPTNLDLLTACFFPSTNLTQEDVVLITAIVHQVEMLFLLHHSHGLDQLSINHH
jgi:hypothetical protein